MISKQYELLCAIREILTDIKDYDELLLENFFYSLAPVVARALLEPKVFKILFVMLCEGIKEYKQEGYYLKFHSEQFNNFAVIISEDISIKENVSQTIKNLHIPSADLVYANVRTHGNICMGYICCSTDLHIRGQFFQSIERALEMTRK
jgi:hypothetical protein